MEYRDALVGTASEAPIASLVDPESIYVKRKDSQALKSELLTEVGNEEYWRYLCSFIHGECSKQEYDDKMKELLKTRELKVLHNQFIKSIIFNATYSMVPPAGAKIEQPEVPPIGKNPIHLLYSTYTCRELGHIWSINQLLLRVDCILQGRRIRVSNNGIKLMHQYLIKFIIFLLSRSIGVIPDRQETGRNRFITITILEQIVSVVPGISNTISPQILHQFVH